jgi:anaerobic selenocysteine-containing dehydrogenase
MNPDDMQENGWEAGQLLDITSHFRNDGKQELRRAPRFVLVPYEIPRRCVATYFPEANVLVPIGSVALRSNTPASKAVIVSFSFSRLDDTRTEGLKVPEPRNLVRNS